MALDPDGLKSDIEAITEPATKAAAAAAWAAAVGAYFSGVIPASTTVSAAQSTLETALLPAMSAVDAAGAAATWETAFAAFAVTVGGGMAGWTPTPPPNPVGFATLFTTDQPSMEDAAQAWSDAIDDWATSGIATLVAPPNTVVNWS